MTQEEAAILEGAYWWLVECVGEPYEQSTEEAAELLRGFAKIAIAGGKGRIEKGEG